MSNKGNVIKVVFRSDVQLKTEYASCQRNYAVFLPSSCEVVQDLKNYLAKEFLSVPMTHLDIFVDSDYMLRDKDPVDVVHFYSSKDKVFECSVNPHAFSSSMYSCSCTSSSSTNGVLLWKSRCGPTDEVDSSALTESYAPSSLQPPPSLPSTPQPIRPKQKPSVIGMEVDVENNTRPHSRLLEVQGAPRKAGGKSENDETPDTTEHNTGPATRSAKRRDRLRRSVAKQLHWTPNAGGSGIEIMENRKSEGRRNNEETEDSDNDEEESNTTTKSVSTAAEVLATKYLPPRRILRPKRIVNSAFNSQTIPSPQQQPPQPQCVNYDDLLDIPDINGIKVFDVIGFKVWELGEGGPCVSDYKEARVVGVEGELLTLEYLQGTAPADDIMSIDGYFADDSFGCSTIMNFQRLIKPKLKILHSHLRI